MNVTASKRSIQEQFDQQAQHYLQNSPMGDAALLQRIVQLADPAPAAQVLDVACGAGLLVTSFAATARKVFGVDLSRAMLVEAEKRSAALGQRNTDYRLGDGEALPYADQTFDIVSCKLAFHYFHDPQRAIAEMQRVTRRGGRIVLVDRVSAENRQQQKFHNQIEKLRTPSKTKVYARSEIVSFFERQGLLLNHVEEYEQLQAVDEWMSTTGAPIENQKRAREMLEQSLVKNLAGISLFYKDGSLMMKHRTAIIVGVKR